MFIRKNSESKVYIRKFKPPIVLLHGVDDHFRYLNVLIIISFQYIIYNIYVLYKIMHIKSERECVCESVGIYLPRNIFYM